MWRCDGPRGHLTGCRVLSLGLLEVDLGQKGGKRGPNSRFSLQTEGEGSWKPVLLWELCLLDMPLLC